MAIGLLPLKGVLQRRTDFVFAALFFFHVYSFYSSRFDCAGVADQKAGFLAIDLYWRTAATTWHP